MTIELPLAHAELQDSSVLTRFVDSLSA